MKTFFLFSFLLLMNTVSCQSENTPKSMTTKNHDLNTLSTAYFAAGCFWCVEAIFESVKGVEEVISGYAGGEEQNPTYHQVGNSMTSHAESVKVYYNPKVVSYATLLQVFFGSHDPTQYNRQGPDVGPQYRSAIFYQSAKEKELIDQYIAQLGSQNIYDKPIVTETTPYTTFWQAEDYHQNYERLHPNNPYVKNVSIPRLKRFQKKYPELLKEEIKH